MRWLSLSHTLLMLLVASATGEWSWNEKTKEEPAADLLEGEKVIESEVKSDVTTNGTVLDDIVDEIISSPQGRSLGGFDDVYADPSIKEAFDSGDDGEARNLIKERLCTLGLMQCEDGEEIHEKRPFVSPDELIYAQPVDIKPVGRPIASIPIRGPPRAYGSAKPVPYPNRYPGKIPPKRVGVTGIFRPDKYGHVNNLNNYEYEGGVVYGKPNGNYVTNSPYTFENKNPLAKPLPPSSHGGPKPETVVQQHVHHHYVHDESNKNPKVLIKPVAIPVGSVGQLGPVQTHTNHEESFDFPNNGFKPINSPFVQETRPIFESSSGTSFGSHNSGQNIVPINQNSGLYTGNIYGNNVNSYANNPQDGFYEKESSPGISNGLNSYAPTTYYDNDIYKESRAEQFDCVCVNYDQCPSQDVLNKREDLILPIDPRNNKNSDIDALPEEQTQNVTSETTVENQNSTATEIKKERRKRETKDEKVQDNEKTIEPRLLGLAGNYGNNYGSNAGNDNKKVQPTFGVSFGLPQASNGGYPLNPFDTNPVYNPYGPALNGGGLNLGLISVNPLVSLQVTKNDFGEKVVKPLVNLHVTPNEHVVNKLGHLFHEKKHYLLNKHEHYHHYPHNYGHYQYKPDSHHYNQHHYRPHHYGFHQYAPTHYASHHGAYNSHTLKPLNNYESTNPAIFSSHYPVSNYNKETYLGHDTDDYDGQDYDNDYSNDAVDPNNYQSGYPYFAKSNNNSVENYANNFAYSRTFNVHSLNSGATRQGKTIRFPSNRKKREVSKIPTDIDYQERQGYFGRPSAHPQQLQKQCKSYQVCCRRPLTPQVNKGQCGIRHQQGINGRIKTPAYVDGDSEFGEYPWQVAILKKDPKESVYVCGGTLIDEYHIITAAHCVKQYQGFELRVRIGEWDVNHDVEFYPYIERDVKHVHVHPQYYAGTLDNDLAILKMDLPVDWTNYPHISPACLPDKYTDYAGQRCWTTGWGKDAFGNAGKYQNILKEVDVPVLSHGLCQQQLRQTRLGYNYQLNPGFICAGGEEGKDACKGDGGGPMVCERGGTWQLVGVVSWGIGCGQVNIPGVYVKVSHYLDWIQQVTNKFSNY